MQSDRVGSSLGNIHIIRMLNLLTIEFEWSERQKPISEQGIIIEAVIYLPEHLHKEWMETTSVQSGLSSPKEFASSTGRTFTIRKVKTK